MKLIAVVGKQGSGKSHFAKLLENYFNNCFGLKCLNISIDKIGHEVLTDTDVVKELQSLLGNKILDENGNISRKKLSDFVFNNKFALKILNEVTLPKMKEVINNLLSENLDKDFIILDYALLPNIPSYFKACDYKILVEADFDERKQRVLSRDGITEIKFLQREKASLEYNPKDFDLIINSSTKSDFDNIPNIDKVAYATCFHLLELSKKGKIAYYPGSFDPITYGHIDIINKVLDIGFDKIIIAVTTNSGKKNTMFSLDERVEMIKEFFGYNPRIEIIVVDSGKASVKIAEKYNCLALVRGLRDVSDFEYELNISKVNATISDVETLFLTASHKYDFVSSSSTRELAYLNEDISLFVPPEIEKRVIEKVAQNK